MPPLAPVALCRSHQIIILSYARAACSSRSKHPAHTSPGHGRGEGTRGSPGQLLTTAVRHARATCCSKSSAHGWREHVCGINSHELWWSVTVVCRAQPNCLKGWQRATCMVWPRSSTWLQALCVLHLPRACSASTRSTQGATHTSPPAPPPPSTPPPLFASVSLLHHSAKQRPTHPVTWACRCA